MPLRSWIADRRLIVAVFALAWVISRCAILSSVDPDQTDVELYFRYAVRGVDDQQVPYRDFEVEYPPVAYWFIALPRLIDPAPVPAATFDRPLSESAAFHRYGYRYEAQAVACDLAAFVLLLLIARRHWPKHFVSLGAGYLGVTTFLWPVMFVRLDIGLTALLMCWAWLWLRSDDSHAGSSRSRIWSYAVLGSSVSFKLVPILMVPFLLLTELRSPRPWRRATQAVLVLAAGVVLPFAVHLPSAGADTLRLFAYHGQRGIQVESLYASLLALGADAPLELEKSFGSWNVDTAWTPLLKDCSTGLLLAFLIALGLWSVWQGERFSRRQALAAACLALCGSVILAKVLSPQYFVWALPIALLLCVQVSPRRWTSSWLTAAALMAVARATTWIFPDHYGELLVGQPWSATWLTLAARNLLYLGVIAVLGLRLLTFEPWHELPAVIWLGRFPRRSLMPAASVALAAPPGG